MIYYSTKESYESFIRFETCTSIWEINIHLGRTENIISEKSSVQLSSGADNNRIFFPLLNIQSFYLARKFKNGA